MKRLPSPIPYYSRLVLCTVSLLFCEQWVSASDVQRSRDSKAAEAATAASSIPESAADPEGKEKPGKYDVDRIGQRSVGNGVNLYSLQKERALGEAMASTVDRGAKFVTDPEINEYIRRLAQKIVRYSDAQVPFTIKVLDTPDRRIFALPGGFLYVDKGLIMAVDSEAELAGLMAHEIAHVAARHATRFATRKYAWNMISIPLTFLSGPASLGTQQIGPLSLKKFNRNSEVEADLLGIEYQYAAGYDPQAFVQALEKLQDAEKKMRARINKALPALAKVPLHEQIERAFANYPPTEDRIAKVQSEISTLLPNRNDYVIDTSEFQDVKAKLAWTDRPILRRPRPGEEASNGPVLRRTPTREPQTENLAGTSPAVTKGRLSPVFSYLPVPRQ
jgi:beta-barrel assembly-enhancing protease